MLAPATVKRTVVALWCLAAAAGCAKVAEQAAKAPVTVREPAGVPEPAAAAAPAADPEAPDPIAPAPAPAIADVRPEPVAPSAATVEPELPTPSASTVALPGSAPEPEVATPATPVAPASQEPEPDLAAVAAALSDDTLDLAALQTRLRKTKAINLRTKLAVKKESEELLERFRAYHAEHGTATLVELRRSYDSLFRRLYSLLEDADPPLARDIDRSRAAIWAMLADPIRFGASAAGAQARGTPQA